MREDKDNSSKWLIEHHGGALLRLSGISGFTSWRTAHTQRTHPTQLPDGLLEVVFPEHPQPELFVLEVATFPERRAEEQAARDAALVWLDRGVVPEVVTLVLHPKGKFRVSGQWQSSSRRGAARLTFTWTVVEMWTLSAENLLAFNDVGVIPWVPLAQTAMPPEALLRQCRERIEQQAKPEERDNLLAVTQVMTALRYNDRSLISLFFGGRSMPWITEIPLMQELIREAAEDLAQQLVQERTEQLVQERVEQQSRNELQTAILDILRKRFPSVSAEVTAKIQTVQDVQRLRQLIPLAACCSDLDAFQSQLPS